MAPDKINPEKVSFRISFTYMLVGGLWILLSDKLVELLFNNKDAITFISMIKGWIFVLVTGLLVYTLVLSAFKRIENAETELLVSNQCLTETNRELAAAYDRVAESQDELRLQYHKLLQHEKLLEESEKRLQHQAFHDQLTGAKNRIALINDMNRLAGSESSSKIALFIVDIDNFKYINDAMGHSFGDRLLVEASSHIGSLVEDGCKFYRLSGDEFIIVMDSFKEVSEVEKLAVKVLKGFGKAFEVDGISMYITVSMGISLYPEQGDNLDELLKNADIALYKAKETGRNRIVFYNKPMKEAVSERVLMEKHLRTALDNNEFELHYQPQLDTATGMVSGFEALLRWKSPELGLVSPLKFISIAEDTHLIIPIGEWVLKNACAFLRRLNEQGHDRVSVSVNISMLQLLQEDFADKVADVLDMTRVNPRHLELEITESILMESYEAIAGKLKLLKGRGIKIALDDFGKGYSSLNYLKQLPISTLKIDKTFIDAIDSTDRNKSLTDLIVKIGKTMDLCVVAEGVETQEQLDYLVRHKCTRIQGFYFSKPVTEAGVIEAIRENRWSIL